MEEIEVTVTRRSNVRIIFDIDDGLIGYVDNEMQDGFDYSKWERLMSKGATLEDISERLARRLVKERYA